MEFVGYTTEQMLDLVDTIFIHNENYVFNDGGRVKLAIRIPFNQIYALFVWNDFNTEDEHRNRQLIQSKKEETVRFFQETTGVIYDYLPRLIYHDVITILRVNDGAVVRYQNNPNTDIILNENGISLEYDATRGLWFVKIRNVVSFSLNNENSARRIYQLVLRDISNYLSFRWGRP